MQAIEVGLTDRWFVNVEGGYEWAQSTSFDIGPNQIDIDLSSAQVSSSIGIHL